MLGSIWGMTAVAAIIVFLRLYTSVTVSRKISIPDYLVTGALILGVACNALFTVSAHFGMGRHVYYVSGEQLLQILKFETLAQPFGMLSPMLARISFAIYLLQLVGPWRLQRSILYLVVILEILVNVTSVILFLAQCGSHITAIWDRLSPEVRYCLPAGIGVNFDYFQGAFNTLVDFILTIIPTVLVIRLQLRPRIKAALIFVLGLSLLASVASIIRTYELSLLIKSADFTRTVATFAIWYNVENFVVIVAASIPTIRPLFTQHSRRKQTQQQQGSGSGSGKTSEVPLCTSGESARGHDGQTPGMTFSSVGGTATTDTSSIMRSDTWEVSGESRPA